MNLDQSLSQAEEYIRLDRKDRSRAVLVEILQEFPDNAEAWILSAQVCDAPGEVLYCLRRAMEINPLLLETHPKAGQISEMLNRLEQPFEPVTTDTPSDSRPSSAPDSPAVIPIKEKTSKPPSSFSVLTRTLRYFVVRILTISITIFAGVFITVLLANKGGQIDAGVYQDIANRVSFEVPGASCWYCAAPPAEQQALVDELMKKYSEQAGLNLPYLPRHLLWTVNALRLDIPGKVWVKGAPGSNYYPTETATDIILAELPHSLMLVGTAFLFIFILGIPFALFLFRNNGTQMERIFAILTPVSSIPSWVLGIVLVLIFSVTVHWLPPSGMYDPIPPENTWSSIATVLKHMVLPVAAIILSLFFQLVYSWKTLFMLYANEDYVDLAKAKGLSMKQIERRYILRPTLPYMITNLTLIMVSFWQMIIALEYIFNWPGIGRLYILALPNFWGESMFPGVMSIVVGLVVVFAYILGITVFALDIIYGLVDPRVRVGGEDQTVRLASAKKRGNLLLRLRSERAFSKRRVAVSSSGSALVRVGKKRNSPADGVRKTGKVFNGIKSFLVELGHYPSAIFGLTVILLLVAGSIYAVVAFPLNKLGSLWYSSILTGKSYVPKLAQPIWVNWFRKDPLPTTIILDSQKGTATKVVQPFGSNGVGSITISYDINFPFSDYPQDLILYFTTQYSQKSPFVSITWVTPDGREINFGNISPMDGTPYRLADCGSLHSIVSKYPNWQNWFISSGYNSTYNATPDYYLLFSDPTRDTPVVLPGRYTVRMDILTFEKDTNVDAELVILGKVAGWAGTDYMRRDLLVPLLWGMPFALALGLVGASVTTILSLIVAAMGVWYGGWLDGLIQRLIEGIMILPVIAIGVIAYAYYNMNIWTFLTMIALLNVFGSPTKSFRAAFLQVKEAPYIEAAKAAGASDMRIILRYLVPSIVPILIPQLITLIPSYVFLEATLGLFQVNSVYPTWGKVIYDALWHGSAYGSGFWVLEPIFLLLLTGLGFAMLGFALEHILNPKLREA